MLKTILIGAALLLVAATAFAYVEKIGLFAPSPTPAYRPFNVGGYDGLIVPAKPVIYLYPQTQKDVSVKLDFAGKITSTYPKISSNSDWSVTAFPDGDLINKTDGKEYSYLFWEGQQNRSNYTFPDGFVVKGVDSSNFLQEKLAQIGLTSKEYNEFIVYWAPQMEKNKYNLVRFVGKEYTDTAKLTITPQPDSELRVFMIYKPLENPIHIKPQQFAPFERKGFTVVEWGGSEVL